MPPVATGWNSVRKSQGLAAALRSWYYTLERMQYLQFSKSLVVQNSVLLWADFPLDPEMDHFIAHRLSDTTLVRMITSKFGTGRPLIPSWLENFADTMCRTTWSPAATRSGSSSPRMVGFKSLFYRICYLALWSLGLFFDTPNLLTFVRVSLWFADGNCCEKVLKVVVCPLQITSAFLRLPRHLTLFSPADCVIRKVYRLTCNLHSR